MNFFNRYLRFLCSLFLLTIPFSVKSQSLQQIHISGFTGLVTDSITLSDSSTLIFKRNKPLLSFLIDEKPYSTSTLRAAKEENKYSVVYGDKIKLFFKISDQTTPGWSCEFIFENISGDTISVSNVVPFDTDNGSVYITGKGPSDLARAWLFRPGYSPVRVILPDNAWELGYTSFTVNDEFSVCAIARRQNTEGGQSKRYQTFLPPKTKVTYKVYADVFKGDWQSGLRMMFRDRYLYDLDKFDNSLYDRSDLAWIKESYIIVLRMAWDREYYDRMTGKYTFPEIIRNGIQQFGYIDVFGIWPTWPRLGLDQRNQWDLYRDLPGGTLTLRNYVRMARQTNTKFFIAYNPWDNSTRAENHLKGLAGLLKETDADGVVLDTQGSSSLELQSSADSVRKGIIMYSEGMAVPKDMPGIISGRVHNAIYYSPELNLNKLIKPDFSIFRVCDVGEDLIHRELAIAFFNGYGTELNMFRPGGRDDNYRADMEFLARTTFILRQNNDAFLDKDWTPLIETILDKAYVNKWNSNGKTIYTVLNMRPEGINDKLFKVKNDNNRHYISLWNHEAVNPVIENGLSFITVSADGWPVSSSGTRKEGSVDCIAELPNLLRYVLKGDSVVLQTSYKGKVTIWKGNPSYKTEHKEFSLTNDTTILVKDLFGYYEGKIVLQLLENNRLKDETILMLKGGKPWLISKVVPTEKDTSVPKDMVLVPGADFSYSVTPGDEFIPYPEVSNIKVQVDSFLIDKYPVTNEQYYEFILSSGYRPSDTTRYLKHWESGIYKQGQEKYPVVNVSLEDMKAYTKWAGKRLPTQAEWQLAAQGTDSRKWPWGNEFHGTLCNNAFDKLTPVDAFVKGASPCGAIDMVGNVWQMTNDVYFNGSNFFVVIRGGSYFKPESSWWYIQGGPQSLDKTQIMLMVSQGYDRSETVGFRCAKDIDNKAFKSKK